VCRASRARPPRFFPGGAREPRAGLVARDEKAQVAVLVPHIEARFAIGPSEPTITISRQAGANASAIARAVGQRRGWPVYDRELLELIASEMGLRTRLVESVDERVRGWLERCLQVFREKPPISTDEYVSRLVWVLGSLAAHGGCVIVGRGAAQVLPAETTLRVRLVGPQGRRVASLRERFDLSEHEARRWVEETDQRRSRFVREQFHRDPDDPVQYDLILNSSRLSVADCADLIVSALMHFEGQPAPMAVGERRA
jgi:cytidylate kinase